jgi:hypothetical protein
MDWFFYGADIHKAQQLVGLLLFGRDYQELVGSWLTHFDLGHKIKGRGPA